MTEKELLEKYGGEKVAGTLGKFNLQSLNELTQDNLENFEKELEKI